MKWKWSKKRKPAEVCGRWLGDVEHSADPSPVTVLIVKNSCGHCTYEHPVCTNHLRAFEATDGIAEAGTACEVCGLISKHAVVSRIPARSK